MTKFEKMLNEFKESNKKFAMVNVEYKYKADGVIMLDKNGVIMLDKSGENIIVTYAIKTTNFEVGGKSFGIKQATDFYNKNLAKLNLNLYFYRSLNG